MFVLAQKNNILLFTACASYSSNSGLYFHRNAVRETKFGVKDFHVPIADKKQSTLNFEKGSRNFGSMQQHVH